jgi:hypothetical protein
VPRALAGIIDRFVVRVLLAGTRASWPLLRLVPSPWLRPFLMPSARRMRRALARAVVVPAVVLVVAAVVMTLVR